MKEKLIYGLCEECYNCRLKKYVYDVDLPEKEKEEFIKRQLEKIEKAPKDMDSMEFQAMLKEEYNRAFVPKDFSKIKHHYNQKIMELLPKYERIINEINDPVLYTLKLALIGNYIDFDAFDNIDDNFLIEMLNNASNKEIDMDAYQSLIDDLAKAKSLVYFTDNCGEVVLDKLFIREIGKKYSNIKITAMLRGEEAINDATLVDAKEIELEEVCFVMGNGLKGTKTELGKLPKDRKELVDEADVLISKGQANAESLAGCGLNIYYIFLCKCNRFAKNYHANKFDGILCKTICNDEGG